MTIALIQIPHHLPAQIIWFGERDDLFDAAIAHALESGRAVPTDSQDAIRWVSRGWHGHILVESANDLEKVRLYQGHQKDRVRAMFEELEDEFPPQESNSHDST